MTDGHDTDRCRAIAREEFEARHAEIQMEFRRQDANINERLKAIEDRQIRVIEQVAVINARLASIRAWLAWLGLALVPVETALINLLVRKFG